MQGNPYVGQIVWERFHQLSQVPDVLFLKVLKEFYLWSRKSVFKGLELGLVAHHCCSQMNIWKVKPDSV